MNPSAKDHGFDDVIQRDVIVIGAGVAGLTTALGLAPRSVALLTKARLGWGGSSAWAQGGIAAAVGKEDSADQHAADTMAVGGGLNDPEIVELLAEEGAARIERLIAWGVEFDRNAQGELALGREAAHSERRILHAHGDSTGAELVRALTAAVLKAPEVAVFEHCFVGDLVLADGRLVGVVAVHAGGERVLHLGRAVVVATGGLGQIYRDTTNPLEATGDGLAMAARAGAQLTDLEFVQFHPTALDVGLDPMPLLTEALRGEGAHLIDERGERFMVAEHPLAELAPRDIVARAIARKRAAGSKVFLDARAAVGEIFPQRFPTVFAHCQRAGLDPRVDALPVAPACHYHMGGIVVDAFGRTTLPGLFAAGEVTSTGAHGANRLASNSLLEAVVFGGRVAEALRRELPNVVAVPGEAELAAASVSLGWAEDAELRAAIRGLMSEKVGVERSGLRLAAAVAQLEEWANTLRELGGETRNILLVARLVATAALYREESRGSHFRSDFPNLDENWQRRLVYTVDRHGAPREVEPAMRRWAAGGRR